MASDSQRTTKGDAKPPGSFVRRHKNKLIVAVLLAVLLGPYFVSRWRSAGRRVRIQRNESAAAAPAQDGRTLRIVTYNIAHGRGPTDSNHEEGGTEKRRRVQEIAELLKSTKADVVVLNEVDFLSTWSGHQNQAEAIATQAGFAFRVEQRNLDFRFLYGSWKFGNAVLSRYPILDATVVDYPPVNAWESWLAGKKRGVVCTLQLSKQQRVRVLAVHIETRSADVRVACVKQMIDLADSTKEPLILAGDFNSSPTGLPLSTSSSAGENAMDLLTASNKFKLRRPDRVASSDFTFSTRNPDRIIDWIVIPRDWEFADYRVLQTDLSDHCPVQATVRIP